jgi:hypothetical protein
LPDNVVELAFNYATPELIGSDYFIGRFSTPNVDMVADVKARCLDEEVYATNAYFPTAPRLQRGPSRSRQVVTKDRFLAFRFDLPF